MLQEISYRRLIAVFFQLGFAGILTWSHTVTQSPYVYPHYVILILIHPALLKYIFGVRLPPWQIAYISFALFAHPMGGLYGWYAKIWWFDHLTHTLSATLVAAIGYTFFHAYRLRAGGPWWFVPLFTMIFIETAGLVWEVVELNVDWLTVYSYNDTLLDYVFNTLGGLLVILTGPYILRSRGKEFADQIEETIAESPIESGTITEISQSRTDSESDSS